MVVHDRRFFRQGTLVDWSLFLLGDISRFADRSRELWSERTNSETRYRQNGKSRLICDWNDTSDLSLSRFSALLWQLSVRVVVSLCLDLNGDGYFLCLSVLSSSIDVRTNQCCFWDRIHRLRMVGETFHREDQTSCRCFRVRVLRMGVIFVLAIMSGFSLILLIVGSLATGATRHQVYTGFRSRLGGRIAMGFVSVNTKSRLISRWPCCSSTLKFSVIVYMLLIFWLLVMVSMIVPCIGLYILKYRCIEAWASPTASGWPNTASPAVCLTPGTYGIPVPRHKPDAKVCQQRFNELCTLVRAPTSKISEYRCLRLL